MESDKINPRNPNPNKLNLFRGKKIEKDTVVGVKDSEDNEFHYGQITDIFDNNMVRVAYYKETEDGKIVERIRTVNLTNPNDVRPKPTEFGGPLDMGELSWESHYELENTFKKASKSKKRKRGFKKHRRSRKKKKQTKKRSKKGSKKR